MRLLIPLLFFMCPFANRAASLPHNFHDLIQYALDNSPHTRLHSAEVDIRKAESQSIDRERIIPQLTLSASYQNWTYKRPYDTGSGLINNNGQNPTIGITLAYDLQKLFGPESDVAGKNLYYTQIDQRLAKRNLVRQLKYSFFTIKEMNSEITRMETVQKLFNKINQILEKQRKNGVNNQIDRRQFKVQQDMIQSELQSRKTDLDLEYSTLSDLTQIPIESLQNIIQNTATSPSLLYAQNENLNKKILQLQNNQDLYKSLTRDYDTSKAEYDGYTSLPLPSLFLTYSHESPTMRSADGPQSMTEIGLSWPIDAFFKRTQEKSVLSAKVIRNKVALDSILFKYRTEIETTAKTLHRAKEQSLTLDQTEKESKKLLDDSFHYFAQKRIDTLGTLDIFQKYLDASKAHSQNNLQIQKLDADLEYLLGGQNI